MQKTIIISSKKQVNDLRKHMGFNISELAKIFKVQRITIYKWLESTPPNPKNQNRLDLIYSFCQRWVEKDVGKIGRYMYRKITKDGRCLMDLLEEETINKTLVNELLDMIVVSLITSIKERTARDKLLKSKGFKPISEKEQKERMMRLSRTIS